METKMPEPKQERLEQLKIIKATNGYIVYANSELKKPLVFETTVKLFTFITLNFKID
jgi:hypothetical protein